MVGAQSWVVVGTEEERCGTRAPWGVRAAHRTDPPAYAGRAGVVAVPRRTPRAEVRVPHTGCETGVPQVRGHSASGRFPEVVLSQKCQRYRQAPATSAQKPTPLVKDDGRVTSLVRSEYARKTILQTLALFDVALPHACLKTPCISRRVELVASRNARDHWATLFPAPTPLDNLSHYVS